MVVVNAELYSIITQSNYSKTGVTQVKIKVNTDKKVIQVKIGNKVSTAHVSGNTGFQKGNSGKITGKLGKNW